jgi:hypothetical protein
MTTEKEINDQIQGDYNKFWNSPYEGKMPDSIMYRFRTALMFHNAKSLQAPPSVMRKLIEKKEYDLNFVEVGVIINTMFAVPFNCMYETPEQAIDETIECKEIEIEFNKLVDKRTQELERKRARLLQLSGITKDTAQMNGATLKPIK